MAAVGSLQERCRARCNDKTGFYRIMSRRSSGRMIQCIAIFPGVITVAGRVTGYNVFGERYRSDRLSTHSRKTGQPKQRLT